MACRKQHQPYTEADNAWFRQHYATTTKEAALVRFPGRQWHALKKQAHRLQATRARGEYTRIYSTWTPERVAALRKHYPAIGSRATADLMGLTRESVRAAAFRLGLNVLPRPKPARKAKATQAPDVARAPKPRTVVVAAPLLAVKRSPGTPILNAAKEARRQKEEAPKRAALVTADEIKRLSYNHPARMAYMLNGVAGWQQWKAQQPGS